MSLTADYEELVTSIARDFKNSALPRAQLHGYIVGTMKVLTPKQRDVVDSMIELQRDVEAKL